MTAGADIEVGHRVRDGGDAEVAKGGIVGRVIVGRTVWVVSAHEPDDGRIRVCGKRTRESFGARGERAGILCPDVSFDRGAQLGGKV